MNNERTIFLIFFLLIVASFYYGDDNLQNKLGTHSYIYFDEVSCRLISLGVTAILCGVFWKIYTENWV